MPVGHSQLPDVVLRYGLAVPKGGVKIVVHSQYLAVVALLNIELCGHSHSKVDEFHTRAHEPAVNAAAGK